MHPTNVRPGNLMKMFLLAMAIRHATVVNANRTGQQPNRGNPNPKDPTKRHVKPTTSVSLTHAFELLARETPPHILNVAKRHPKNPTKRYVKPTTSVSLTHALELLARTEPPQMLNVAKRQYKPTKATVTMSTTE